VTLRTNARARGRDGEEAQRWRPAALLPRDPAQDLALTFVAAVLCFFACLSVLAAVGAHHAASGWTTELRGSATVVIRPTSGETPDTAAERAAETLSGVKGVSEATALERQKAEALVRPWLGDSVDLDDLPVPRLVAVQLDRRAPATAAALRGALATAHIDGEVDDHSRWIDDITRGAAMARTGAVGVALLMAMATAAVIVLATRAGLAARGDVVEVLHLAGAKPMFIVGLFQARFARLAGIAGAIGAAAAAVVAALYHFTGTGAGLVPIVPIRLPDLIYLIPCPVIAAVVAIVAARYAALRRLEQAP
jgi:cell division transport system permease protein